MRQIRVSREPEKRTYATTNAQRGQTAACAHRCGGADGSLRHRTASRVSGRRNGERLQVNSSSQLQCSVIPPLLTASSTNDAS